MDKSKKETTSEAAVEPTATYEVICHDIEIGNLICYRTHRLPLTKAQADAINTHQPGALKFVGVC